MDKKIISKILAVTVSLTAFATSVIYADSDGTSKISDEYTDAVDFVTSNGIMEGDENGNLNLDDTITRAEFIKMLLTAADGETLSADYANVSTDGFADVGESHWAKELVDKAHACGFIDGYEDNLFHPDDTVTYAQAIKLILAICGVDTFATVYPYGYISEAVITGVTGDMQFNPSEPITREETAELMYNAYMSVKDGVMYFENINEGRITADNMTYRYFGYGLYEQIFEESIGYDDLAKAVGGYSSGSSGGGGGSMSVSETTAVVAAPRIESIVANPYMSTEEYTGYTPNSFRQTSLSPLSTFSIDTDTASYSNMRRFISNGRVPAADSVRTEEIINYFDYETPQMAEDAPFGVTAQITDCPWSENKLARITIAGEDGKSDKPSNLVFVIDVSGSMSSSNKLPMLKRALLMLTDQLDERDTVSIVTYSGSAVLRLEPTSEKEAIRECIKSLCAGGGTNGADGLNIAYETAEKNFNENGNNRIILCSDGDFNIGPSSTAELEDIITEKRRAGIYLTTMGFGMGNYKDNRMELMADKGNGSYYYIDNMREAKKVFADDLTKTLHTVADDVKLQVEFNPGVVKEYRLVGYENRTLNAEDFNNDTVDAGELGAGAQVTVIYELVMGSAESQTNEGEYRYQTQQYIDSNEAFDVKIRYKKPGETESILKEFPIVNEYTEADNDTKFASAAAMLGLKLNGVIDAEYSDIAALARESVPMSGDLSVAERWEFIQLTELLGYID